MPPPTSRVPTRAVITSYSIHYTKLYEFEGDRPVLILLDEMPPYFHYLDTQKVGNGTVADIALPGLGLPAWTMNLILLV